MLSDMGRRPMVRNPDESFGDELDKEIGVLISEKQRHQEANDIEKELNMYRSGSAPPTVEGSLNAVGGLFGGNGGGGNAFSGFEKIVNVNHFVSEEDVRSDPAYLSYYYSKVNLNPRLPPPLLSKEDWRSAQRLKGGGSALGGIGDKRKVNRSTENGGSGTRIPFAMPRFNSRKEESEFERETLGGSAEWGTDGLICLSGLGIGSKQNSLADIFQNDLGRTTPVPTHASRPASRNAFDVAYAEAEIAHISREMTYSDSLRLDANVQGSSAINTIGPHGSYSYAAVVGGSLSRSTTPDPLMVPRAPSPSITPIRGGENITSDKRGMNSPSTFDGVPPSFSESADMLAALSSMSLSENCVLDEEKHLPPSINQHSFLKKADSWHMHMPSPQSTRVSYSNMSNSSGWLGNSHSATSSLNGGGGLSSQYQPADTLNSSYQSYGLSGYGVIASQLGNGSLPPLFENAAAASAMAIPGYGSDSLNLNRMVNQMNGNALQVPFVDPTYLQYIRTSEYAAAAAQLVALNDPTIDRNYYGNSYMDLVQKSYMGTLLSPQKLQYSASIGSKSSGSNHQGYYGNPSFGVGLSYPGSPIASPIIPNSPVGMRGHMGTWHLDADSNLGESSLLDEFKSNKSKCFELSEIAGHVVEFSADQYGSRFIQQKLETATIEEKNMVYQEIFPQSLSLMTDVFGNYVIQKFFEHGLPNQRRELANKLYGHVLTLSLQMYGCRVIQKAIEVVDMDQKVKMVEELDGHVMRCVRDQNGNHVIQKCIECLPEEAIQFIVTTFFDQVVTLSTHPYGCRVIQRVLEHCPDPMTQSKVMDEVLGCVSMLAQDQYGNYVIQHVLEHGKPHERSIIIKELAGKIVQMSQQKFASNVVEKCLAFGGPAERQLLVVEMLGYTDENEPLQAMMKDQFANYVVQKVLETCEDQQRELILTRIKIHLNALKKYTYGKHIVSRVEKLVAAGERRTALQNSLVD